MAKFILKRAMSAIPTLIIVLCLVFIILRILPGSVAASLLSEEDMTKEEIEAVEERLGLNKPIWEQFADYIGGILSGNWGTSYLNTRDVIENIVQRLEPTIMIAVGATIITVLVGIPMGVIAATHRNSWLDYLLSTSAMLFRVVPTFWLCMLLVYYVAFQTGWFPVQGYSYIAEEGFLKSLQSVALPCIGIGMSHVAATARHTRSAMLQVLGEDYVRTAKAKGLSLTKVRYKHALRNTLSLIVTTVCTSLAGMLGGSTVVEKVFNIPGVGKLALDSLMSYDYPQEQAIILFFALIFIVLNIVLDILYKLIDPRVNFD